MQLAECGKISRRKCVLNCPELSGTLCLSTWWFAPPPPTHTLVLAPTTCSCEHCLTHTTLLRKTWAEDLQTASDDRQRGEENCGKRGWCYFGSTLKPHKSRTNRLPARTRRRLTASDGVGRRDREQTNTNLSVWVRQRVWSRADVSTYGPSVSPPQIINFHFGLSCETCTCLWICVFVLVRILYTSVRSMWGMWAVWPPLIFIVLTHCLCMCTGDDSDNE